MKRFTSLTSCYQIYYYSLLYAVHIPFLVKDGDITRNINILKCLNLQSRSPPSHPLTLLLDPLE